MYEFWEVIKDVLGFAAIIAVTILVGAGLSALYEWAF